MDTRISNQKINSFLLFIAISFFLHVPISSATEFYLIIDGTAERKPCDALVIKNKKFFCGEGERVINYDLSSITAVHIIDKGAFQSINNFTPDSIERINWFNQARPVWKPSGKQNSETAPVQKKKEKKKVKRKKKQKKKSRFSCKGKVYCSEMSSCAEAKFYLRNCPGVKIDGDNDGVPCERQCR